MAGVSRIDCDGRRPELKEATRFAGFAASPEARVDEEDGGRKAETRERSVELWEVSNGGAADFGSLTAWSIARPFVFVKITLSPRAVAPTGAK